MMEEKKRREKAETGILLWGLAVGGAEQLVARLDMALYYSKQRVYFIYLVYLLITERPSKLCIWRYHAHV